MKRKGGNDIGKMIKLNKAVPMVLLACAYYQRRGPLYLIAGTFMPNAEQPIWFKEPKLFAPRNGNSFYTSYTVQDGKGVLWFNDAKFYLLGREIGPEWFE